MYESLRHIDKRIIFRETFNSEQETRRLGGVPTNIVYENGVGKFNGDNSNYSKKILLNGTYTFRIIVSDVEYTTSYLFDCRGPSSTDSGFASLGLTGESSQADYINGQKTTILNEGKNEIIINSTFSTLNEQVITIGSRNIGTAVLKGNMDLFEIYEGTLTPEEVKNLYENKTYQELPDKIEEQLGDQLVVTNGGADNTTDWVDSDEDGLADDWFTLLSPITSIVSGNGFTGNAQRIEASGAITAVLGISSIAAEVGKQYKISFKYRTNSNKFIIFWSNDLIIAEPELNEGDAIYYEAISTCIDPSIRFYSNNNGEGKWIEVDEVKIEEVKNTDCEKILDVSATQGVLENKTSGDIVDTIINNDFDFTEWDIATAVSSRTTNSYVTSNAGGVRDILITPGSRYRMRIKGSVSSGDLLVRQYTTTAVYTTLTGSFDKTFEFTAEDTGIYLRTSDASGSIVIIEEMTIQEIIPELTPTDIDIKKIGNVYAPSFNGSTSKIDCGNFDPLTGDITVMAWINPRSFGENNIGTIFSNGKFWVHFNSNYRITVRNDGSSFGNSINNVFEFNKYQLISIRRASNGYVELYVNGKLLDSFSDGGIPEAGNILYIGVYNISGNYVYDGKIPSLKIYKGILSTEQIAQEYSNTKRYYE